MSSIFLCHSSVDKSFVKNLATDLRKMGVYAWFDSWEIKVGESLLWKIEHGIRENEFFSIILSPEALNSEWVKTELGAAMHKQISQKKVVILPVLFRDCDIPYILADKRYADFRNDYQQGLRALADALGISAIDLLSEDNWRWYAKNQKNSDWKPFREKEFEQLVTQLTDQAMQYNWSTWVGGSKMPFSIMFEASIPPVIRKTITLGLNRRTHAYHAAEDDIWNPNHLKVGDFNRYVGNTMEECQEYIWRHMSDFQAAHGNPTAKAYHFNYRFSSRAKRIALIEKWLADLYWYKGDRKKIKNAN